MPELSLLYGPAHPDKIQPLLQTCLERIRQRQGDSFLFLVPTRGQAEQLQQNLLCKSDADLFLKPYILGLEDFIRTLYHACPGRLALLPEVGQQLLIEDTLRHNSRFFNYFSSTQREPFSGLSLALARFVRDLKTAGITPDDLAACRADLPGLAGDKGEELVQIYRHFQQGLGKDFTDLSGMLHSIATHLDEERFRACFPRIDLFLISGFDAFAPPLLRVLVQLLDFIPESCIALDYVPERPRLFGPARDTFAWLRKRATQKTISTATSPNAPLAALESHLFTSPAPPQKACMEIVPCADRLTEIKKIARRIRYLWNAGPLELARVRVACRHIDLYAPLIQEVFPRYGLRFHLAQGYPLPRSPVVVSILAVLDVVLERYSRPALLRLLKLPYIEFKYKMEGRDQTLSAAVVDTWTRTLPPTSGRVEWLQAIDLRCAQLERELANIRRGDLFSDELDDPDKWVEQGREERHKLRALRRGLEDLFTALVPMEQRLDLPAFRRHLHHVLGRLGLFGRLVSAASDPAQQERIGPAISAFKRFSRLLDELATLAPLLKQQRFGVREIADILKTSLSQVHYHFPGKSEQGIQITTLEESRSPSCDHLFVVGLLEGEFPLSPAPDIFLDDSDRRTLGLQSADAGLAAERLLFYQILAQARREIQLLYPRGEGTTTLSPSPFVDEVQVLLSSGEKPQPHADILTLADLHRFLGRSLSRKPSIPEATQALQLVRLCGNVPLLSAPVHHLRGMAIADQRAQAQQLGPYEGLLDHPAALDSLERRFGRGHAFSITQLESYARCPFFFFADRILGAVPLRDPGEDLAALERGNLIHRILYAFYRERRRNGQVERVRPENLPQALQRLRQIARSAAEDLGLKDFFWEMELERILGPEDKNKGAGLLPRFLELEARELGRDSAESLRTQLWRLPRHGRARSAFHPGTLYPGGCPDRRAGAHPGQNRPHRSHSGRPVRGPRLQNRPGPRRSGRYARRPQPAATRLPPGGRTTPAFGRPRRRCSRRLLRVARPRALRQDRTLCQQGP